jgi:hypothetical protein
VPAPFEGLEDRLLKGGIAPRHVKRYLRELSEHLADLTQAQRDLGYGEADAASHARAALGPDAELADAMLKQRDFRSISARFPWAVFTIVPPLVMLAGTTFPVLLLAILGKTAQWLSLIQHGNVESPRLQAAIRILLETGNLLAMPLALLLMTAIVWRQRLSPAWLLLSLLVLWPLILSASVEFPATAEIARKSGAALSVGAGLSTSGSFGQAKTGLMFSAAHYGFALVPLAGLLWRRRRATA